MLRRNPNYERAASTEPLRRSSSRSARRRSTERRKRSKPAGADYVEQLDPGLAPSASARTARAKVDGSSTDRRARLARAGRQQLFEAPVPAVFSFIFNDEPRSVRRRRDCGEPSTSRSIDGPSLRSRELPPPGRPDRSVHPSRHAGVRGRADLPPRRPGPDRRPGGWRATRIGKHSSTRATRPTAPGTRRSCARTWRRSGSISRRASSRSAGCSAETRRTNRWDMALWGWAVDYADPFDYINNQFSRAAPGSEIRRWTADGGGAKRAGRLETTRLDRI